jgi:hypothetical protein
VLGIARRISKLTMVTAGACVEKRCRWQESSPAPQLDHGLGAVGRLPLGIASSTTTVALAVRNGQGEAVLPTAARMIALMRSFVAIERLGYSPDNPPPDSRVN